MIAIKRSGIQWFVTGLCVLFSCQALAGANKTKYPVIFAHGLGAQNDLYGIQAWGNDWGTIVHDSCDSVFEVNCNDWLASGQKAAAFDVPAFGFENRGIKLANKVESYMHANNFSHVNMVGHSGGALDIRYAANELRHRFGRRVVKTGIGISGPNRGNSWCKYILDNYPSTTSIVSLLFKYFGKIVYTQPPGDLRDTLAACNFDDYSPNDGVNTSIKSYNASLSLNSDIESPRSVITVQQGASLNPSLWLVNAGLYNHDGDGYCSGDCDGDGGAGKGDGSRYDTDDDGIVPLNSQQYGYRLKYTERLGFDRIKDDFGAAYVSNVNYPPSSAMTSHAAVLKQDHLDVTGIGPDTFDELEYYAALIDYIADKGH